MINLWSEKYRPKTIDECILIDNLKGYFKGILSQGNLPNLILAGKSGVGKTTVAKALCEELEYEYIIINGSSDRNIDTLRSTITSFASTLSLNGKPKAVIFDEGDYLNPQSTQPALRNFIEKYSGNCRFLFTCNYKNKIIPHIHSRCSVVDFTLLKDEKVKLGRQFMVRVVQILNSEGVKFNKNVIGEIVLTYFPDFRRTLNELQRLATSGKISAETLEISGDLQLDVLTGFMKEKDFTKVKQWCADHASMDMPLIYRGIYDMLYEKIESTDIPKVVYLLALYQYQAAFAFDQEINLLACLSEIMIDARFT